MLHTVGQILALLLQIYVLLLLFRLVMEYVFVFARTFRPTGLLAAALEVTYTLTDPPLKLVRRLVPPLRLGQVSLDLAFLIVLLVAQFAAQYAATL